MYCMGVLLLQSLFGKRGTVAMPRRQWRYHTGVEHEFMVQSRGGHFSIVTATLEHSKKYVFQADVAVAISD